MSIRYSARFLPILLVATLAAQNTLQVPSQFADIQAAIFAAAAGDTVLVDAGTYSGNINFLGKAITVRTIRGAAKTTIVGTGVGAAVIFSTNETALSVLEGFTISGGKTGIIISNASPIVRRCVVTGNTGANGTNDGGFGIVGSPGGVGGVVMIGSPVFVDCMIVGNTGGIGGNVQNGPGSPGYPGGVGGVAIGPGTPAFRRTLIAKNTGGRGGSRLHAGFSASLLGLTGAGGFGGVLVTSSLSSPATATFEDCAITKNMGGDAGPGVNLGARGGGGVLTAHTPGQSIFQTPGNAVFIHSTIAGNNVGLIGTSSFNGIQGASTLSNSILAGSSTNASITAVYSATAVVGLGNTNQDPQIVFDARGRPRLSLSSPCRDVADPAAAAGLSFDLFGNDRVVGSAPDMGAAELPSTDLFGTNEDFFMDLFVNGTGPVGFTESIASGDVVRIDLSTTGGYENRVPVVVGQLYLPVQPPGSVLGFPQLHLDRDSAIVLWDGFTVDPLTPVGLPLSGTLEITFTNGLVLPGYLARVQAVAFNPFSANGIFAVSDAFDLTFL